MKRIDYSKTSAVWKWEKVEKEILSKITLNIWDKLVDITDERAAAVYGFQESAINILMEPKNEKN